jgi:2-oxoglutarate dehydrogenase E1 component
LQRWLSSFSNAKQLFWVQEEPQNMGGWNFMRPWLEGLKRTGQELRYVGRVASASPATGSYTIHQLEQQALVQEALSL